MSQVKSPAPTWWLMNICNSVPGDPNCLLALGTRDEQRYAGKTLSHINRIFFKCTLRNVPVLVGAMWQGQRLRGEGVEMWMSDS